MRKFNFTLQKLTRHYPLQHCQIIPDDLRTEDTVYPSATSTTTISVQAFTPILGTLLLSSNPLVGGAARYAVVDLLSRMNKADLDGALGPSTSISDLLPDVEEDEVEWTVGLFLREEREMFRNEILQQVVIGMGRLDVELDELYEGMTEDSPDQWHEGNSERSVGVVTPGEQGNGEDGVSSPQEQERERSESSKVKDNGTINPYFPVLASPFSVPSPSSSAGSTPSSTGTAGSLSSSSSSPGATYATSSSSKQSPSLTLATTSPELGVDTTSDMDITPPFSSSNTSIALSTTSPSNEASSTMPVHDQTPSEPLPDDWVPSAPRPSHATLPPPVQPTTQERWSSADLPGGSLTTSPPNLPSEHRHYNMGDLGTHSGYDFHGETGYSEDGSDDGEEDEQAAVGRLSSMSLMAAVTANGQLFAVYCRHLLHHS